MVRKEVHGWEEKQEIFQHPLKWHYVISRDETAFIIPSYYCPIDSLLISVSWIIVFTSVHQWRWISDAFDNFDGMLYQWGGFTVVPSDGLKSGYVPVKRFQLSQMKDFTLWFCVSNKTVDSHYRRERRLSFFPPWESQSATAAVARGSFLQMNNRTLLFFSITVFYRKCPSIPLSCRPRTWRATWTLAFPTQPLPSSLSRTSMTTLPCWPPELWVITNEVMGNG